MRIAVAVLVLAASLATQDPARDLGRVTQDPARDRDLGRVTQDPARDRGLGRVTQDPARDRGLGRVTDTHGKPWPDAEVHLLHRPHHAIADPAFGEEIVLTTDAKGQFKTGLLVGSAYWAWAIGPLRADGSYRVTRLQHDAVARSPILLREGKRQFVRKLRPELHQSWHGKERLRWRATTEAAGGRVGLSRWLEPDEDGVLTTPRWPDFRVTLQGWTDDWLAYRATFPLTESMALAYGLEFRSRHEKPEAGEVSERLAAVHEFVVPPRRTRELLLRDASTRQPIADAEIRLDMMPHDIAAHRSDPNGIVHAVFAHEEETVPDVPYRWTVLSPGHAEHSLAVNSDEPPTATRELPPGQTLRGRLFAGEGEPAVGIPIMLEGSVATGPSSTWFGIDPRVFRTDKDGAFSVRGRNERFPFRITAALAPAMRARLGRTDPTWPIAPLAVLHWGSEQVPANFGPRNLAQLPTLDVQIRQPDGTPPGSTRLLLTRVGLGDSAPHDPVAVYTDNRGRIRILLPGTEGLLVHAITHQGAAWQLLEKEQTEVSLTIDPRHVVRFTLSNQAGRLLANRRVGLVTTSSGEDDAVPRSVRNMCAVHAFAHQSCRVDQHGRGTIIAPMLDITLDLVISGPNGGNERVAVPWSGPVDDQPIEIVVSR